MHIAFFNPQGNFDPNDSYWTEHPDFGGQLVYVKEVAIAMGSLGHRIDIVTRQIIDSNWPEFSSQKDFFPGIDAVRILRFPCGPKRFLPKEDLWPYLGTNWVPNIVSFYKNEGSYPDFITTHYGDGGISGALFGKLTGTPFSFTAHSLGAQKMDKMEASPENLRELDTRYNFRYRVIAERTSMNHAHQIITSTNQERVEQYGHKAYSGALEPTNDDKFSIVPPGVNTRLFSPSPSPIDAGISRRIKSAIKRDVSNNRQDLPLIVCSSRLDPKKNHIGLVRAFSNSSELQTLANLAIVVRGLDNPLQQYHLLSSDESRILGQIVSIIEENQMKGKITAFPLNSQEELAAAYRELADNRSVFALTALYEPFGLAPLEAMSCGLPAVVTSNGGPSESLVEGGREYGILIDPIDHSDIAQGLLKVLKSKESWEKYHRAGIERVQNKYTWDRTAEGYMGVIDKIRKKKLSPSKNIPISLYFTNPIEYDIPFETLEKLYLE